MNSVQQAPHEVEAKLARYMANFYVLDRKKHHATLDKLKDDFIEARWRYETLSGVQWR